jgi:glycosyltransferase involved in cell wall biosynthesis
MDEILISLIVPTRGRPEGMLAFLESVHANASAPQNIEAVMVVDEDDPESQAIAFKGLSLVKVVVPPGLTMGALVTAGYRASSGEHIMLANDDIVVKTKAWDDRALAAFRSFPDGIALIHVNDTMQQDNLCIFPFVSRKFCELSNGICPEQYIRYRIDDHIHHVFEFLARYGHERIVYLPDVVFEHLNVVVSAAGKRAYIANPKIQALDTALFYELADSRKELALRLAAWIDSKRQSHPVVERGSSAPRTERLPTRRPKFSRFMPEDSAFLQRLPPFAEREIGRLSCALGLSRIGTQLWNHAKSRRASRMPQPVLVDPDRYGFAVFLYDHKYFFVSAKRLAALGGRLSAEQCQKGALAGVQVVESLAEASALVGRLKGKAATLGVSAG